MNRTSLVWLLGLPLLLSGCVSQRAVLDEILRTEDALLQAQQVHAAHCAPTDMARAEAQLDFTRIELHQGDLRRASQHVSDAYEHALVALQSGTVCGAVDTDGDGIPDILDRCPDEPEDFDGFEDEDGCPDP